MSKEDSYNSLSTIIISGIKIKLTPREIDIISCIICGQRVKQIGILLELSHRTVENHVHNIRAKLKVASKEQIIDVIDHANYRNAIINHYNKYIDKNQKPYRNPDLVLKGEDIHTTPNKRFIYILAGMLFVTALLAIIVHKQDTPTTTSLTKQLKQPLPLIPVNSWNLPKLFNHFVNRKALNNTIWQLFGDSSKQTVVLAGLHGLGGIGKTTLANGIINDIQKEYDFRAWFSAESEDLLKSEYIELGGYYKLFSEGMSDNNKIKKVKQWLASHKKLLLVYDNVPDMSFLNNYMPSKGHIIITSRNYKIPHAIELGTMRDGEALSLLSNLVPNNIKHDSLYIKLAKELLDELGNLPLAISQAGSYINENKISMQKYLNLYRTNKEKMLTSKTMPSGDMHESVYVTWDMSIKNIKSKQNGKLADRLLNFISACYPEHIPRKLLIQFLYNNTGHDSEIKFNEVVSVLRNYSLITLYPTNLSIHRLVHNRVGQKQSSQERLNILRSGAEAIKKVYPKGDKTKDDIELIKQLLPHIESIILKLKDLVKPIEIIDLLKILCDSYDVLGGYDKRLAYADEILQITRKHYGKDDVKTADALLQYARTHIRIGNFAIARNSLLEALPILNKKYGHNCKESIVTLYHIGWVNVRMGNYQDAIKYSAKAAKISEAKYGKDHLETAKVLNDLGWIYTNYGDYKLGKSSLEKSLSIVEKQFGVDHILTGTVLRSVGWIYLRSGMYSESLKAFNRTFTIRTKHYGERHIKVVNILDGLGALHCYLNNYDKAQRAYEHNLKTLLASYKKDHIFTRTAFANLGNVYRIQGKNKQAKEYLLKALPFLQEFYGKDNVKTAAVIGNITLLNWHKNSKQQTLSELQKILKIFTNNLHAEHVYIKATNDAIKNINNKNYKSLGYFIIL